MPDITFLIRMQVILLANAEGALEYFVNDGEQLEIYSIYQKSTGAFDIIDFKTGGSTQQSNASAGDPLDNEFIQDVQSPNIAFSQFVQPIIVRGGTKVSLRVKDTSGAGNTVEMMLQARRTY